MADIVEDQGDMVTSIEFNIESTSVQVTEGTEQLRQAKTFKVNLMRQQNSVTQAPQEARPSGPGGASGGKKVSAAATLFVDPKHLGSLLG